MAAMIFSSRRLARATSVSMDFCSASRISRSRASQDSMLSCRLGGLPKISTGSAWSACSADKCSVKRAVNSAVVADCAACASAPDTALPIKASVWRRRAWVSLVFCSVLAWRAQSSASCFSVVASRASKAPRRWVKVFNTSDEAFSSLSSTSSRATSSARVGQSSSR